MRTSLTCVRAMLRHSHGRSTLPRTFATTTKGAAASATATTTTTTTTGKEEGSISSVFASLSGQKRTQDMPARFHALKCSMITSDEHAGAVQRAWREVLASLQAETAEVEAKGETLIAQVEYPGDEAVDRGVPMNEWSGGQEALDAIKRRGTVIVKGVVPTDEVLQWKQDVRDYIAANPQTKGFPAADPQVFELYWSKAQLAARGHPSLLRASGALLSLWNAPRSAAASLRNVVSYCDRLRIRMPGDAQFALGAHVDGGGVERWEDPVFRNVWRSILTPSAADGRVAWRQHDSWTLGAQSERLHAQTDMYNGAGACSVFRPLQGWLSMSSTGARQGTLRVLPILQSATAYIVLRPFFRPVRSLAQCDYAQHAYLHADNWRFSLDDGNFDGCSLGHNLELDDETHPHLRLSQTMTSIPRVEPGDCAFWHCDVVHSVESRHTGQPGQDSSVMYIPAIPLTDVNSRYLARQRDAFTTGTPPPDFPGGQGESTHVGRGTQHDIVDPLARRAMGLMPFHVTDDMPQAERDLIHTCNQRM